MISFPLGEKWAYRKAIPTPTEDQGNSGKKEGEQIYSKRNE